MTFTSGERYEGEWQVCTSPRTTHVVCYTTHTEHSRALYSKSFIFIFINYNPFISTSLDDPLILGRLVNYGPKIRSNLGHM
jgi:hypothetical protein